jgi:hypothetical protein
VVSRDDNIGVCDADLIRQSQCLPGVVAACTPAWQMIKARDDKFKTQQHPASAVQQDMSISFRLVVRTFVEVLDDAADSTSRRTQSRPCAMLVYAFPFLRGYLYYELADGAALTFTSGAMKTQ